MNDDMSKVNDKFIAKSMYDNVEQMQISLANMAAKRANLGFTEPLSSSCVLSIICLLNHALENRILYSTEQYDSLLTLYNKVIHG